MKSATDEAAAAQEMWLCRGGNAGGLIYVVVGRAFRGNEWQEALGPHGRWHMECWWQGDTEMRRTSAVTSGSWKRKSQKCPPANTDRARRALAMAGWDPGAKSFC